MIDTYLVPQNSTVTAEGNGPAVEISVANERVFLLNLKITNVIEQESLDVSIWGSPDGIDWGQKALLIFPQKFYRGEHPLLLDLTDSPQVRFLRAHWVANRWGRGDPQPFFEFELALREVPKAMLQER